MKFIFNSAGVTALYTDKLDLSKVGVMQATRVSDVSFRDGGWHAFIPLPVGTKIPAGAGFYTESGVPVASLGPFNTHGEAVIEEQKWIEKNILLDLAREAANGNSSVEVFRPLLPASV